MWFSSKTAVPEPDVPRRRSWGRKRIVLLAWELGGGLGHINRLLPIARDFAERGHAVVFVLRHPEAVRPGFETVPGAVVMQAPLGCRHTSDPEELAAARCHYGDILLRSGYGSPESLGALVADWRQFFDSLKPNLIVCDHSPTAVLAASGRIPTIVVGSGFAVPPAGKPLLVLNPDAADGVADREMCVLHSIQAVQSAFRGRVPQQIAGLFDTAESFACCFPELDPYAAVRLRPAIGPMQPLPLSFPTPRSAGLFGYLNGADPGTVRLVERLAKARVSASLYVRQRTDELEARCAGGSIILHDAPQPLAEVLVNRSGLLHHGGLSTTEAGLAIGRPQFLVPRNLEQLFTSETVERLGCGVNLGARTSDPGDLIRRALRNGTYTAAAAAVARGISQRKRVDVRATVLEACLKHLE